MTTVTQHAHIRGCLLGALAGDCLGSLFEVSGFCSDSGGTFCQKITNFVKNFPKSYENRSVLYTDDTAMMRSVAESLIDNKGFNASDMAKKFSDTFFNDRRREYGANVIFVFKKLKLNQCQDPFGPAKEQFGGNGSYGNGGSMRVSAVPLFYANNLNETLEVARMQCLITHSHPDAIMGAVLQSAAVYLALHWDHATKFDKKQFINELRQIMKDEEKVIYPNDSQNPFVEKIDQYEALLENNESTKVVALTLGTGIAASRSVPAAIFSFIRCHNVSDEINIENPLVRTLAYAISLGGDTDTIGTMAGAIAGAYYGDEYIPKSWLNSFEGSNVYLNYADAICKRNQL